MKKIHVIMPFSRHHLAGELVSHYEPMGIVLRPVTFADEPPFPIERPWIVPLVIPYDQGDLVFPGAPNAKVNYFIENAIIKDDDYYCLAADDDGFEPGVFPAIKAMDNDVIFISLKRGDHIPEGLPPERRYPTSTLLAHPDSVQIGLISGEQYIVKGKIFKTLIFDNDQCSDGRMAMYLKDHYSARYEPKLFALFNYFEPGRWDKGQKIAFGVLVNDLQRLDMVLRQSHIDGDMHFVKEPETATKGLNKLLAIMEGEGVDIAILTHQDMFYRQGWIPQVREQLAKLPESWIVAGIIGKDMKGNICGKFHDMRIPLHFNTSHLHEFPQPASCFDECCIIVNMKKGFRFDETLTGFDLYGTLCVLQAWEQGGTAWIIDAFAEHYCMRPFSWFPDKAFSKSFKWLHDRFPNAARIDTTVIGVPKEIEEAA